MREITKKETPKLARLIIDIAYLLSLPLSEEDGKFSTRNAERYIEAFLEGLLNKNLYPENLELILLTQSKHDDEEKFHKIIDEKQGEFITYAQLKDYITPSSYIAYFWNTAKKIPAISVDGNTSVLALNKLLHIESPEKEIATFIVLAPNTHIAGELPAHYYSASAYSAGTLMPSNLQKVNSILESHFYEKIIVYSDFDHTLCNTSKFLYTKNNEDRINPELASFFKKIRASKHNSFIRLLTARPLLGKAILYYFKKIQDFLKWLEKFNIAEASGLIQIIASSHDDIEALEKKGLGINDEFTELKPIFARFQDVEKIIANIENSLSQDLTKEEKNNLSALIAVIEKHHDALKNTVGALCVVDVSKKYHEMHDILIEFEKDSHLSSATRNLHKADYIAAAHQDEDKKTLVLLVDDNPDEIKRLNNRAQYSVKKAPELYPNVDVVCIKVARDNEFDATANRSWSAFLDQVATTEEEQRKAESPISPRSDLFKPVRKSDEDSPRPERTGSHTPIPSPGSSD